MRSFLAVFLLALAANSAYGYMQNITAEGLTICGKKVVPAFIELRERDTLDPDDTLDKKQTGKDGRFRLFGKEDEATKITPYLRVTHDCDVPQQKGKTCKMISTYEIPKKHIGGVYNPQYLNLQTPGSSTKITCEKEKKKN
ncbi:hypothetical protein QR680_004341 [Steinernema hermaphroditum]|uniref:Transthyretin-like family protein n=1 Tax=Steinernema hermaphroditum TaxID=289476 RepID=A0AA39HQP4_9BILA|nr:hypothetical protein QR680_004341 [Steinernema hermaphroditum]